MTGKVAQCRIKCQLCGAVIKTGDKYWWRHEEYGSVVRILRVCKRCYHASKNLSLPLE